MEVPRQRLRRVDVPRWVDSSLTAHAVPRDESASAAEAAGVVVPLSATTQTLLASSPNRTAVRGAWRDEAPPTNECETAARDTGADTDEVTAGTASVAVDGSQAIAGAAAVRRTDVASVASSRAALRLCAPDDPLNTVSAYAAVAAVSGESLSRVNGGVPCDAAAAARDVHALFERAAMVAPSVASLASVVGDARAAPKYGAPSMFQRDAPAASLSSPSRRVLGDVVPLLRLGGARHGGAAAPANLRERTNINNESVVSAGCGDVSRTTSAAVAPCDAAAAGRDWVRENSDDVLRAAMRRQQRQIAAQALCGLGRQSARPVFNGEMDDELVGVLDD